MTKPILNIADLELQPFGHGDKFEARVARLSPQLGAQKLGYNVTVLPPGKRAFPFHSHRVNEEMFFVLEGEGEVRIGDQRHPIKRGDIIACPAGGPETAHQIINSSNAELRYLGVSTNLWPEIAEYPDSKKFGVLNQVKSADGKTEMMRFAGRLEESLDYWDGE